MIYRIIIFILFLSFTLSAQVFPPNIYPKEHFHKDSVYILISVQVPADVHFTKDGSIPTRQSPIYTQPLLLKETTVIRAKTFVSDTISSTTETSTYFINENTTLPVISLSTDPANFFSNDSGIYVTGNQWWAPNYLKEWERPVHIEMYETDHSLAFSMDAGVKIFGEGTTSFPQKSLNILARKKYGTGKIRYKIFPDINIDDFESILLRNAGGDWNKAMLRDGLIQYIVKDLNVDRQAYRPAIMFLNGEYWGIHNIRERSDENFIASHHDVHPDSIDLIKYFFAVSGSKTNYDQLIGFIEKKDLNIPENYDYVKERIDIDEFLNYTTTELYFDNTDWPGNNFKFWRSWRPDGKWRWLLYDLDCGLDMKERESWKHKSLTWTTSGNGIDYFMPKWSNEMLNGLLKSNEFRNAFINRLADLGNTLFTPFRLLPVIDKLKRMIEPEIPRHFERWDSSVTTWYKHIGLIEQFINQRLPYIQQDYISKFNLKGKTRLTLRVSMDAGKIKVNSAEIGEFPWSGEYFSGVPVKISAVPDPGFVFTGWQELNRNEALVSVPDSLPAELTAIFEPDTNYSPVVINEINYNSAPDFDTEDWIELVNSGSNTVDLSGWIFRDSDPLHLFSLPQRTFLNPEEFIVLCRDSVKFKTFFPGINNVYGNFDFGLNNAGEHIELLNSSGGIADSLTYDDEFPWLSEADGTGKTLELKSSAADNSLPENWGVSSGHGTPGVVNSVSTQVEKYNEVIPQTYLFQNYPNPFNTETVIKYSVNQPGIVELKIYDLLGRFVSSLLNDFKIPGEYKEAFSSGMLASGVYYVIMKTGDSLQAIKIMLLK